MSAHTFEKQPLLDSACKTSNFIFFFFPVFGVTCLGGINVKARLKIHKKKQLPFYGQVFGNNLNTKLYGTKQTKFLCLCLGCT
jgi:hypothetical protein